LADAEVEGLDVTKGSIMSLKAFLQCGGTVVVSMFGKDRASKSGGLRFLADVRVSLQMAESELCYIRGNLKQFTTNGNLLLDFSNSMDSDYPNSGVCESIKEFLNEASVIGWRNKSGVNGRTTMKVTLDKKGNYVYDGVTIQSSQLELSENAKSFLSSAAAATTQFVPRVKVEDKQIPQAAAAAEAATALDKVL
jgi:hypothetical protein